MAVSVEVIVRCKLNSLSTDLASRRLGPMTLGPTVEPVQPDTLNDKDDNHHLRILQPCRPPWSVLRFAQEPHVATLN